jgi:ABC-type antimicrobial peptide transport system permease subunit
VHWLVIGKTLKLTLLGAVIGLAGAAGLARTLSALVPGLETNAPIAIILMAGVLVVIAVLASWIPARRASSVDPIVALKGE